ncbi:SH3 domain-containing protein [Acidaminobacter sp. JC074]|uniref:SH3 domain-containing protein n=1 Tax=Acidaminobacter sp. JC074 TaxID=2530199 RepID=UPI001F0DF1DC|nr:SH3 domain-containing protein [Acidaminobacter sp. JC074]MCH4888921.1 SH3 domain-containing protein [Acidaminobacter sp. JC074]
MRNILMILLMSLLLISCQTEEVNEKSLPTEDMVITQHENVENDVEGESLVQVTEPEELQRIQVVVDALKIRQEATTDSEQVGTVFYGSVFEVLEKKKDINDDYWYRIQDGDQFGWIASWFCEATFTGLQSFDRGECYRLSLSNLYYQGSKLVKSDLVTGDVDVYIDSTRIEDDFILDSKGKHLVYTMQGGMKSPLYTIEVIGKDIYGLLYESPDSTLNAVDYVKFKVEVDKVESIILSYSDRLNIWYEILKDNKQLYLPVKFDDFEVMTSTYQVKVADKTFTFDRKSSLQDGLLNGQYVQFTGYENTIINLDNGHMYQTKFGYHFLDDNHLAVYPTSEYQLYGKAVGLGKVQVVDLSKDNEVVYEYDKLCTRLRSRDDDGKLLDELIIYSQSKNNWLYADNQEMIERGVFEKINGKWQLTSYPEDINEFVDREVTVYKDYSDRQIIGSYMVSELNLRNPSIIDIIDGQYVYWFEAWNGGEVVGYIYRPKYDYEKDNFFYWQDFSLVMNSGLLYTDEQVGDESLNRRFLLSILESQGYYTLEYSYEGNYIKVLDKDNETVFERIDSRMLDFDDQNRLFVLTIPYGPGYVGLEIIKIEEGQFIEEFKIEDPEIYVSDVKIISDQEISFTIEHNDAYPALLKYINGEWLIETDYEFKSFD